MSDLTLKLKILADASGLTRETERARLEILSLAGAAEGAGRKGLYLFGGAAAAATVALSEFGTQLESTATFAGYAAGIAIGTTRTLMFAKELEGLSAATAMSVQDLRAWQLAGGQFGVSAEDVSKTVGELSSAIAEMQSVGGESKLAESLSKIGVSLAEVKGMKPDELLGVVVTRLDQIKGLSAAQKSMLLEEIASGASKLAPLLQDNAKALTEIRQHAELVGAIITPEQQAVLKAANGELSEMRVALEGVSNTFGHVGAEIISTFGDSFNQMLDKEAVALQVWADGAIDEVHRLFAVFENAGGFDGSGIRAIYEDMFPNLSAFTTGFGQFVDGFTDAVMQVWDVVQAAFSPIIDLLNAITGSSDDTLESIGALVGYIGGSVATIATVSVAYGLTAGAIGTLGTAAMVAATALGVAGRAAQVLGLILSANPIGAVALAVAGLTYGIMRLAEEENAATGSVQLASGEMVKYGDITDKARQLNNEYTTASKSKKQAIEGELRALSSVTEAEIKSAAATLGATQAKLAALKISNQQNYTPEYNQDGEYIGDYNAAGKALEESYQKDIDNQIASLQELNAGLKSVADEQGNLGSATESKAEIEAKANGITIEGAKATGESGIALQGTNKAHVEAAKVIHAHGDAMKSLIEGLTKQRIELEHGKLAAQYYTDRLNGLTDAEARAAAGAGQYNSLLAERKKLNREAAELGGGLRTKYNNSLEDQGLSVNAMSGIDAAQAATERAIAAADKYQGSIDSTTDALKRQADAANEAASSAVGSFVAQGATIQKISGDSAKSAAYAVQKLQSLGWSKNQAIGIAANLQQESKFNAGAVGDSGKAYGIAQWHPDRQANFSRAMGKNIRGSSLDDQLAFLTYEMTKGTEKGAGNKLKGADSAAQAAAIVSKYYERPLAQVKEMEHRAGIANGIAKSLGNSVPSFAEAAQSSEKVATETAKAIPSWESVAATATAAKDVTIEYGGAIDSARASQADIIGLADQYMSNQAQGLIIAATDHAKQVQLTGAEYRDWQLTQQEFNDGEKEKILLAEQLAAYADEAKNLEDERTDIRAGQADQYQRQLEKQNLAQEQIASLVAEKMAIGAEKLVYDAERETKQLQMSGDEWRKLELSQDGYNAAQIVSIAQAEKHLEKTKEIKAATDAIGDGLLDALMKSATGASGVMDTLASTFKKSFDDLVLTPTLKPITQAISAGLQGTIQGTSNPWSALQQQYAQTMGGIGAGGVSGAMTAAGVGASIGGLTGSQEGSIGGSIGGAAGSAIGMALGGPVGAKIGSVIGSVAGGLIGDSFKDDDSARAAFTNGSPTDGFVNRDGNKLSATSKYGTFGFQEDGTHDLGSSAEKEMAAFVQRMAAVDNALSEFIPASETARITAELAGFQHSGTDFAELFKQRLVVITSGLSETMRGLIDYSKDADGILARINDLIAIQKEAVPALRNMNMQIGATDDAALSAAAGLADAAGGLQNLTSVASTYYQAVYSEDEQKQNSIRTAQATIAAFNAANNAQVSSLSNLRQYVEGLDLTSPAAQQASIAAMGLVDELQLLAPAMNAANDASASALDSANAKLADQQAIFGLFNDGLSEITSGLDRQLSQLEDSYRDQIAAFEKAQDAADGLRDALQGLRVSDATTLTPEQQLAEARKQFANLQTAAKGGDIDAASKLESAGDALLRLSREYNASSVDYSRDFAMVENGWSSVADLLENQRDPQQDMLDAQRGMIDQAASQAAQLAAVYGGILGGNTLLDLMGKNIDSLPPDIAIALNAVLKDLKPPTDPPATTLTIAEYKAKALNDVSKLTDPTAIVLSLYPLLLNKAADDEGKKYWADQLKSGVKLEDMISRFVDEAVRNGDWAKVHPNSHATGLDYVPYDDYKANLHKGEAVIDAASMNAMRKYGIPLQSRASGGNIVVNVDMQALVSKVESLTVEVRALRSERSQDAQSAAQQRNTHIKQSGNTERGVIRAVKMRGGK